MKFYFDKAYIAPDRTFPIGCVGDFEQPTAERLAAEGYGRIVPDETRARMNASEEFATVCAPTPKTKEKPPAE